MQSRLSGWILQYKDKIWLCWAIVSQWRSVVCGFWMIYFRFARLFLVLHLGRIGERIFSKEGKRLHVFDDLSLSRCWWEHFADSLQQLLFSKADTKFHNKNSSRQVMSDDQQKQIPFSNQTLREC
jgi:hypothetical protein